MSASLLQCGATSPQRSSATVALPASLFCLCVQLERISSVRQVSTSVKDKRRRKIIDALLCFGVPTIYMTLRHLFDTVEDFGCRLNTYVSLSPVFLIWVPSSFFSFASFALHHFIIRRITFARHLRNSNSALTPSRYFRLMSMALVQIFWDVFGEALRNVLHLVLMCCDRFALQSPLLWPNQEYVFLLLKGF